MLSIPKVTYLSDFVAQFAVGGTLGSRETGRVDLKAARLGVFVPVTELGRSGENWGAGIGFWGICSAGKRFSG